MAVWLRFTPDHTLNDHGRAYVCWTKQVFEGQVVVDGVRIGQAMLGALREHPAGWVNVEADIAYDAFDLYAMEANIAQDPGVAWQAPYWIWPGASWRDALGVTEEAIAAGGGAHPPFFWAGNCGGRTRSRTRTSTPTSSRSGSPISPGAWMALLRDAGVLDTLTFPEQELGDGRLPPRGARPARPDRLERPPQAPPPLRPPGHGPRGLSRVAVWLRFLPDRVRGDGERAYVTWVHPDHEGQVLIHDGQTGEALAAALRAHPAGFVSVEWDIAYDGVDVAAMEAAIAAEPERAHMAPYLYWPAASNRHAGREPADHKEVVLASGSLRDPSAPSGLRGPAPGERLVDFFMLGCTYLPGAWLHAAALAGVLQDARYPDADGFLSNWLSERGMRASVVWEARPKHLNFDWPASVPCLGAGSACT